MDGVLVDSFRPEDFALQMSRLMSDRARWREMALEARRSVAHNTWDRTAQEFLCMLADRGITRSNDRVAV
jgi:glycosyltransferase involved in cell wall biosynthesis